MSKIKAVVINTEGKYMRVATRDRQFLIVLQPPEGVVAGQEIWIDVPRKNKFKGSIVGIAAAAVILLLLVPGIISPLFIEEPVAYLNVDINPSFEFAVDSDYKVLKAIPLNEEAKIIAPKTDLENKKITQSMNNLVQEAQKSGYISLDIENFIMVTVVNVNDKDDETFSFMYQKLKDEILSEMAQTEILGTIAIQRSSMTDRSNAQSKGITLNDYILKEKVAEKTGEPDELLKNMTATELLGKLEETNTSREEVFDEVNQMKGPPVSSPGLDDEDHPGKGRVDDDFVPPGQDRKDKDTGRGPQEDEDDMKKPNGQEKRPDGIPKGPPGNGPPGQQDNQSPGPPGNRSPGPPENFLDKD